MEHEVDAAHGFVDGGLVEQVALDDAQPLTRRGDELAKPGGEIVEHGHARAAAEHRVGHVAADEARAARHEDMLAVPVGGSRVHVVRLVTSSWVGPARRC